MSQTSDRQQTKRNFLNVAKSIFADGGFDEWMPTMIFLGIPIAFGFNLYMLLDGCLRNIVVPILISPFLQAMRLNDIGSWQIGYMKIGIVFVDVLAFMTVSFSLFVISRVTRKMV